MAAVKSELKADVAAVKSDLAAVKSDLAVVKSDVGAVKADVAALRSEMAVMKSVLEFKIEDSKEKMIDHMDKKFGEYVSHVDAVFGEIKTIREEQVFIAQHSHDHADRIGDHDKRITRLEVTVGGRAG